MNTLSPLLTDLYQLTMAYGYWKSGKANQQAVFHLFFRKGPFGSGCAIAAGLQQVMQAITEFQFREEEIRYLKSLTSPNGKPLFEQAFLDYLMQLSFTGSLDAVPEGTVLFPQEPVLRIESSMIECQLLETMILNLMNFQTLIATKAARICEAAAGDAVLEFGLRRAHGPNGGLLASRAAYIGGCLATSNVEAGKVWGIPVRGTHGHSWIMSFEKEEEAFRTYAISMPDPCILLVDTYDTLEGIRRAITIGKELKGLGRTLAGIRLDSGDLVQLSIAARSLLDEAGFVNTKIVASNDLDEQRISTLKQQGARIDVWGVGTRLVTADQCPSLGGVYKLSLIQDDQGDWMPRMKISSSPGKSSMPGKLQTMRVIQNKAWISDMIVHEHEESAQPGMPLLQPMIRKGQVVASPVSIEEIKAHAAIQRVLFRKYLKGAQIHIPISPSIRSLIDQLRNLVVKTD